jgi:hypothetical protein
LELQEVVVALHHRVEVVALHHRVEVVALHLQKG